MKPCLPLVGILLLLSSTGALAEYSCPALDDARGGWLPPDCPVTLAACKECGTVERVQMVETDEASGIGAVAGAVAGGLLGNQVGKGRGRTLATIAGAVGGGVAGHYGEKYLRKKTRWDVTVLMDDGSRKTIGFDANPGYAVGDKVRVTDGTLSRNTTSAREAR
ncbi:MAG: glycine zipper 2TM domain-containing protein [Methylophilaceae bacterium]|nr:glycine zipper 2TM domain-containing protein [Methylophilaceae bacterium]